MTNNKIAELTEHELDAVSGGARVEIGPFYIDAGKGELSIGIKGVATVTFFGDGGVCGHIGGNLGHGGCI